MSNQHHLEEQETFTKRGAILGFFAYIIVALIVVWVFA